MRSIKSRGGLTRGRGFTESVRHQWVHTAHQCAIIHETTSEVTQVIMKSSEQHEEKGKVRKSRDFKNLFVVQNWFYQHNPFDESISGFKSISSGICSDGSVNCDETESVGKKIQEELDGVPFTM